MLMIYGSSIMKLPFNQAYPFTEHDIAIAVTQTISIVLNNITTDSGELASIAGEMEAERHRKIFGEEKFINRMDEFKDILTARFERYFAEKDEYIFFDEVEQKLLSGDIFCVPGLSCRVGLYKCERFRDPKEITIVDLNNEELDIVCNFLEKFGVVYAVKPKEAIKYIMFKMKSESKASFEDFTRRANDRNRMHTLEMRRLFNRYPKLERMKYKFQIDWYFKQLKKKYHPDLGGSESTCSIINGDHAEIKLTLWYTSKEKYSPNHPDKFKNKSAKDNKTYKNKAKKGPPLHIENNKDSDDNIDDESNKVEEGDS